ncbi:MAG: tetratricopeptide repeat protein [bacterium]|nr:tetratricopeptide repeat protein [bacterium]
MKRLLESFSVDPADTAAFQTLEERLFLDSSWSQLAGVYECRVSVLSPEDPQRVDVLLRLAGVLHEKLSDDPGAQRYYQEVLAVDPEHVEALGALRRLHAEHGELTQAVQISEIEESLSLPPKQRARVLTEIGELWLKMGDCAEAQRRFDQALRLDPVCDRAQAGCAALAEAEGRLDEAILLNERRLEGLSGPIRYKVMEHLATLLPDSESDRIRTLLREVVRVSPERRKAIERLLDIEQADANWDRVDELQRRLFTIVHDPVEKLFLAQEAGLQQLEQAGNMDAAKHWVECANEIGPNDVGVQKLRARILRKAGNTDGVIDALEKLLEANGASPMTMLEVAVLHERSGDPERAVDWLERLLDCEPNDDEALAVMDRCLERLGRHTERADVLARRANQTENASDAAAMFMRLGELRAQTLNDPQAAESAYKSALERLPSDKHAISALSEMLRKSERFEELATLVENLACIPESGNCSELWCELGAIRIEHLDDVGGARSAFLAALDLDPECPTALRGLRQIAERSSDPTSLVEACERELSLDPPTPRKIELLREMCGALRSAGDLPGALRTARRWIDVEAAPDPLIALCEVAREMGDVETERSNLQGLESLLGNAPKRRALVLTRLGDLTLEQPDPDALETAADWYRESLSLAANPALRSRLIDLLRRTRQLPELVRELREQLHDVEEPEQLEIRVELARALAETGDLSAAVDELRPVFANDPSDTDPADLLESLLAEQDRMDELVEMLALRLEHERAIPLRRELAHRQAGLLLDGMGRSADAVAVLRDLADPSRAGQLEDLFSRALEAGGTSDEHETWLSMRESHVDGPERASLLLRLASLQEGSGQVTEALGTLRRARRYADTAQASAIKSAVLALLRTHGSPREQLEFLDQILEDSETPAERAAFRIERARLWAESLGEPEKAIEDLEQATREAPLGLEDLRLVATLYSRTDNPVQHLEALQTLAKRTEDAAERRATQLEIAEIFISGPSQLRSTAEATHLLEGLLEADSSDREAHDLIASVYEAEGRTADLCHRLASRLEQDGLFDDERMSIALRLGRMQLNMGQAQVACSTLRIAREGSPNSAIDELLLSALDAADDLPGRIALCEELAMQASGAESLRWLRRWLNAMEAAGEPTQARLAVVERILEQTPDDPELNEARLPMLRELASHETLAEVLESSLRRPEALTPARRRLHVLETLQLLEGPLAEPERALQLIEREVDGDAGLAMRGARLARKLDDPTREAALLHPLAGSHVENPAPDAVRRLALALWRAGEAVEAEPLLWDALVDYPSNRELLAALETVVRRRDDPLSLLRLLDARFPLESGTDRLTIAREGFEAAEGARRPQDSLRWIRRLQALDQLNPSVLQRWLGLELEVGDRPGTLGALRALSEATDDPAELADLLAQEGSLHLERGQLALARDEYREALATSPKPRAEWLETLNTIMDRLGETAERVDVLRDLSQHPDLDAEARVAYQKQRIELLGSHPDLREEAALELRVLIDSDPGSNRDDQVDLMRDLLELYEQLGRLSEWCTLAERLAPFLPGDEARRLERRIAEHLTHPLCATDEAIAAWERVLERDPNDADALSALEQLLSGPGNEARRVPVLERLATAGGPPREQVMLEVADLRWHALGDARAALSAVDGALSINPDIPAAQLLRSELCERLDRPEEEEAALRAVLESGRQLPNAADSWLRIAELAAAKPNNKDAAIEALERGLQLDPSAGFARRGRGILERVGAWQRAADLLRIEIAEIPEKDCARLLRRLARIEWDELENAREACEALEALAEVDLPTADDYDRWSDALAVCFRWNDAISKRRLALESMADLATAQGWFDLAQQTLEHMDDATRALDACDRALQCDPTFNEALSLRAQLHARLDAPAMELEDTLRLAEHVDNDAEAADAYTKAARLSRGRLGDDARAWALYRKALKRDPQWTQALLGAGEIALERGEWNEAERMFGLACSLLPGTEEAPQLGRAARLAATAALEQQRNAEAYRHLELALDESPDDVEALDAMADLSLRLGAPERARDCLDSRLANMDLSPEERAERLLKLAQACEGSKQLDRAAAALEEAVALHPDDEVSRARAVDLLERIGESDRAVVQLDGWMRAAPEDFNGRLALRAAQLELSGGNRREARNRLEHLVLEPGAPAEAWVELARLTLDDDGASAALEVTERGLETLPESERGTLLWLDTQSLESLGRIPEAARRACETLHADPANVAAAQLLAAHLGKVGDWAGPVKQLERTLDVAHPTRPVESELWEAIGRAYAGPLEDLERAQLCYRRSLECNPLRASAREALADTTAFDPAAHRESIRLHRDLLEEYPARLGSWRSIEHMGQHWRRDRAQQTCIAVLRALGSHVDNWDPDRPLSVMAETGPSSDPGVSGATELLLALEEVSALPKVSGTPSLTGLPVWARKEIAKIIGAAWDLPDDTLRGIWVKPDDESNDELPRRARRRLKRALSSIDADAVRRLDPMIWREQIVAQAAASALQSGSVALGDILPDLIELWPETAHLDLRHGGSMSATIQSCPPARSLLLRIGEAAIAGLGL